MTKQFKIVTALLLVGAFGLPLAATPVNTDLGRWPYNGVKLKGKNAVVINKNGDVKLYQGSVVLGNNATTPAAVAGSYYGLKVPFYNVGASVTVGDVIVSSATGTGYGAKSTTTNTLTAIGVADGTYASGTVGYITVAGYAVVHTTAAVAIGDVLVSSASTAGYAATNNSPSAGTNLGVALSTGAAAGDSVLIRLR